MSARRRASSASRWLARALWLAAAVSLPSGAARAGDVALLPSASLHLEASRYAPSEPQFQWTSWIGGGVTAAKLGLVSLYGTADLETVVGNERRGFDANQANYHLETGFERSFERWTASLFFNHVSRHLVDREKTPAVDWNVLGLRVSVHLSGRRPTRLVLGAGRTTLASLIGYRFELTGDVETDVLTRPTQTAYLRGAFRLVTTKSSPAFPRKGLVDTTMEAGLRFRTGNRALRTFLAYEHRNDVFLLRPGSRDRALIGFRITLRAE